MPDSALPVSVRCLVPCKTSVAPPKRQHSATATGSPSPLFTPKNAVLVVVRAVSEMDCLLDTQEVQFPPADLSKPDSNGHSPRPRYEGGCSDSFVNGPGRSGPRLRGSALEPPDAPFRSACRPRSTSRQPTSSSSTRSGFRFLRSRPVGSRLPAPRHRGARASRQNHLHGLTLSRC